MSSSSDPPRMREDEQCPSGLAAMLDAARDVPEQRLRDVGERLGVPPPDVPPPVAASAPWLPWAAAAAAAVAIAIGAAFFSLRSDAAPAPRESPRTPEAAPTSTRATNSVEATPRESSREDDTRAQTESAVLTPASTRALPSELALLSSARSELAAGRPEAALRRTQRHRTLYPRGELTQEREVLAIEALVALDRHAEAAGSAEQFRAAFPDSAHRRRLEELLRAQPD